MSQEKIDKAARWCLANGISVIPIGQDKMPAIKWKPYIERPLDRWNFPGCNMAIITGATNGIVVVDCDTRKSALQWLSTKPKTPLMTVTRRGLHFYYRHPGTYVKSASHINVDGINVDIKADRSYVLAPNSVRSGHEYRFIKHEGNPQGRYLHPEKLPLFDVAWRPESTKTYSTSSDDKAIRDIRTYISKIQASEGSRDRETFRVSKLVQESGAPEAEAVAIVVDWHMKNCNPPWEVMEIAEKVKRIYNG
jgi:hypothetical protein